MSTSIIKTLSHAVMAVTLLIVGFGFMVVYVATFDPESREIMNLFIGFISELAHQWVGYLF